ncbi:MAG: alpha/beta hydrolase [Draconibacterium sp.]
MANTVKENNLNGFQQKHLALIMAVALLPAMAIGQCKSIATPTVQSSALNQQREVWVALPDNYDRSIMYPVLYVLDAETQFNLASALEDALSGSRQIPEHIVVGVPHTNKKKERVKDLTFSLSEVNPYGDKILPPFFNDKNCGGGYQFLNFLNDELVPFIDSAYSTNGFNILCGHSLSGYFAAFILSGQHSFQAIQLYDPSIWYASGEATKQLPKRIYPIHLSVYLAFQKNPDFHYQHIKAFGEKLDEMAISSYKKETFSADNHHSVFLPAFLSGIKWLYSDFRQEHFKLKKEQPYAVPN